MKHKTHIKRISIFYSLSSFFLSGFIFQNKDLSAGENLPILPVTVEDNEGKFYPASFLSSIYERSPFTVDCPQFLINIKYHHRCELKPIAIEKISKFSNSNTLTIQNPANQEIYTLLSGFIPKPNLGENEIDALKILCDPN
ncbi:MAG: hypothetical protein LBI77_02945, partial [Puniceicoccales bacterium]|nr:hypothetical protein [Puniceicoccales bacterium]